MGVTQFLFGKSQLLTPYPAGPPYPGGLRPGRQRKRDWAKQLVALADDWRARGVLVLWKFSLFQPLVHHCRLCANNQ